MLWVVGGGILCGLLAKDLYVTHGLAGWAVYFAMALIAMLGMMWLFLRLQPLEEEPNQAPTSTAVTPPADAGDRASGTRGSS